MSEFKLSGGSVQEEVRTPKKIRPEISTKQRKRTVSTSRACSPSAFPLMWLIIISEYLLPSVYEGFWYILLFFFLFWLFPNLREHSSSSQEQLPKFSSDSPFIQCNCRSINIRTECLPGLQNKRWVHGDELGPKMPEYKQFFKRICSLLLRLGQILTKPAGS